jgi:hypothetical protein
MSRLSTLNSVAVALPHVPYALFVDLSFVSGNVRLTSYDQAFTFGGNTYTSLGTFAQMGDYPETVDLTSSSLTFTLSGVDSSLLSTVFTEKYHNRDAKVYVGWLDQNNVLVDTPFLLWEGFIDSLQVHAEEGVSSIALTCETRLLLLGKTAGWTYSDVHQKQFFTGDSFFNLVASLQNKILNWGAPGSTASSAARGTFTPGQTHANPAAPTIPGRFTPT